MGHNKKKIEISMADKLIEAVSVIILLIIFFLPQYYYNDLPAKIPIHFNISGQPNNYAGKVLIWLLPFISLIFYLGFIILKRMPHILNYPAHSKLDKNKEQNKISIRILRYLLLVVLASFLYLVYGTINVALQQWEGIGSMPVIIIVLLILLILTVFVRRMVKLK